MRNRSAIAVLFALGCADDRVPTTERDVEAVSGLLDAIDIHRTVAVATDPASALQLDENCRVDDTDLEPSLPEGTMRWEGPCFLEDGALLDGSLTSTPSLDGLVLSAEGLQITAADELQVSLAGAIELSRVDDLLQLHVSIQACGVLGPSCATQDPTVGLDLDYSIYPMHTFPEAYSVSVSGAVDGDDTFVSVEGAWQTDDAQCDAEPLAGTVAFGTFPRQTLVLTGNDACDGCVAWQVEGIDVEPLCDAPSW